MEVSSLRAFSKLVGVTPRAVQKAAENGRLEASIGYDARGRPFIADVELAKQEWVTNRNLSKVRG